MKFFLDTANLDELKKGVDWGLVDGVTTNPTLIAREGVTTDEQIRKIVRVVDGDISAEVVSTKVDEMIPEARRLAAIHKNVVVKLPLTRDGIKACSLLSKEGIRINITLCFSAGQALLAAKAGAHIGTMPFKVLDMLFNHPLTDNGLAQFLKDYQKVAQEAPVLSR